MPVVSASIPRNSARGGDASPRGGQSSRRVLRPVAAFVGALRRRLSPRPLAHGTPTALQGSRRFCRSYLPHTPGLSALVSGDGGYPRPESRSSPRAPKDLPRLAVAFAPPVTSLAGFPSRSTAYVRVSARHSFRYRCMAVAISVGRTQKLRPTRRAWTLCSPAPSPAGLTGKRFVFAPLVVELFPAAFSRAVPGPSLLGPVPLVAEEGGPHASTVTRAFAALVPVAGFAPALNHHGPTRALREGGVSLSPPLLGAITHRIERPVCGPSRLRRERVGFYPGEPPSNWASTSRCTQLYGP